MIKKLVPAILAVAALGVGYKFVIAKEPAEATPKPKIEGSVYMLQKDFLVNLADGRFVKLQVGLVLAHDDTSTAAEGGHGSAAAPPEGYGAMSQEGLVRDVITDTLTGLKSGKLISGRGREDTKKEIREAIEKRADVKVEKVLFADLVVQ